MVEKVKNAKMINLIIHEIRSRWIAILSWGIGLIIFGAVYMSIFPEGVLLSDIIILTGAAAVFYILSLIYFSKRNITVGAWPWQRDKITD